MKSLIVALALGFAAVAAVAPASAQTVRGKDCQWAYKKLQQHQSKVFAKRCFEGGQNGHDGGRTDDARHNSVAKDKNSFDRIRDALRD